MSEPVDLVEQELQLIDEIERLAGEQYALKVVQRQNTVAVRAWRINVMQRVNKINSMGTLTEDEYKTAKTLENKINDDLDELSIIPIDSEENHDEAEELVETVKKNIKQLKNSIFQTHKLDTMNLIESYSLINDRWNELSDEFEDQFDIQQDIEERNLEIQNNNSKLTKYQDDAEKAIKEINQKLNPLVVGGDDYASWDHSMNEISLMNEDEVASACAEMIYRNSETRWGTVNFSVFNELPEELRNELSEEVGSNEDLLNDLAFLKRVIVRYIDKILNSVVWPEKPKLEYQELEPEINIELPALKTGDIKLNDINPKMVAKKRIPEEIVQEIQNYRKGKFSWTVKNAGRINEIAQEYGLLGIDVTQNNEKQSTRKINRKIRELMAVQDSFGSERNSRTGQSKIKEFVTATRELLQHSHNQQRVFEGYYEEFLSTAQGLEDWINRSWWQFGGQPENHHGAGKGDSSEVSYQKKNHGSKYSGPTL